MTTKQQQIAKVLASAKPSGKPITLPKPKWEE